MDVWDARPSYHSHPQGRKTEVFSVDDRGGMENSKKIFRPYIERVLLWQ